MKSTFNERLHQAEIYYIFDAEPGAISHLGLKNGATRERFLAYSETVLIPAETGSYEVINEGSAP